MAEATDLEPIVVRRVGRGVWGFRCPGCFGFTYERTSKAKALAWAADHNGRDHAGRYEIQETP